jgi:phage terminase large subunit
MKPLKNCEIGDYIKVISNGKGLLKDLTTGKKYYVINIEDKNRGCGSKIMFKIRNDKNKLKWYCIKQKCWFEIIN